MPICSLTYGELLALRRPPVGFRRVISVGVGYLQAPALAPRAMMMGDLVVLLTFSITVARALTEPRPVDMVQHRITCAVRYALARDFAAQTGGRFATRFALVGRVVDQLLFPIMSKCEGGGVLDSLLERLKS